ncbi:MAG: hypothetical protein ACR2PY_04175, partial [Salinispira sp.]
MKRPAEQCRSSWMTFESREDFLDPSKAMVLGRVTLYIGIEKTRIQHLLSATAYNLKRVETNEKRVLAGALTALSASFLASFQQFTPNFLSIFPILTNQGLY